MPRGLNKESWDISICSPPHFLPLPLSSPCLRSLPVIFMFVEFQFPTCIQQYISPFVCLSYFITLCFLISSLLTSACSRYLHVPLILLILYFFEYIGMCNIASDSRNGINDCWTPPATGLPDICRHISVVKCTQFD